MVLREAAPPPDGESFSEAPPASDMDQYAGDTNPTYLSSREPSYVAVNSPGPDQVFVNLSNMPQPWTLFGRRGPSKSAGAIAQQYVESASNKIGRPVRQEEAEAIVFHQANAVAIATSGTPMGLAFGLAQAWRGTSTFRFPFWTPPASFDTRSFGTIKGNVARGIWQAVRYGSYSASGMVFGNIVLSLYALSNFGASMAKDPRLQDVRQGLQEWGERGFRDRKATSQTASREASGPKPGETYEMARQRQAVTQRYGSTTSRDDSDMSPTGGAFGQEYREPVPDTDLLTDDQLRQQASRQKFESRRYPGDSAPPISSPRSDRTQQGIGPTSELDDDASSADKPAGSKWAQIRQRAVSGAQPSNARSATSSEAKQSPGSNGSVAFSSDDVGSGTSRSEAQRRFDDRIEREREGKDFDDSAYSPRKW